jgi:hypothetical protein
MSLEEQELWSGKNRETYFTENKEIYLNSIISNEYVWEGNSKFLI